MKGIYGLLYFLAICSLAACRKDTTKPSLAAGSISIQGLSAKDTLVRDIPLLKDTTLIIGLKATLNGQPAAEDHFVTFRPDTTKMAAYRALYGEATLLPFNTYLFYNARCRIPAGATVSDSMQLNLITQSALKPYSVYVLPVVIQSVDGSTEGIAPGQVLYLVVKAGKANGFDKQKWSITATSEVPGYTADLTLDKDDENTYWSSDYAQIMPQSLLIDFSEELTFSGVTYRAPSFYYLPGLGGYPTKVKIEVSLNGTTWTDKGTFDGVDTPVTWSQDIGPTTARYLRFTVVEAIPFFSSLSIVYIGGISILP